MEKVYRQYITERLADKTVVADHAFITHSGEVAETTLQELTKLAAGAGHPFRRYRLTRLAVLCPHTAAPAPWACCSYGSRSNNKLHISCAPMSAPGRAPIRTHGGTLPCILVRYSPDARGHIGQQVPVHSLEGFSGQNRKSYLGIASSANEVSGASL